MDFYDSLFTSRASQEAKDEPIGPQIKIQGAVEKDSSSESGTNLDEVEFDAESSSIPHYMRAPVTNLNLPTH